MQKGQGLRKYFYEYVFYKAIEQARTMTGQVIPISQAKAMRAEVDARISAATNGSAIADPNLSPRELGTALEAVLRERVPGYGDKSAAELRTRAFTEWQTEFMRRTGISEQARGGAYLPISPYDPQWSERASIKRAGTSLRFVADADIDKRTGGVTADLAEARYGEMDLWSLDGDRPVKAGSAMTLEDASGLTALMDKMSEAEYHAVRDWVILGARKPNGEIDPGRFMTPAALQRSLAVLTELQSQGATYKISMDQKPGQIKARIVGTGLDIRLTDTRENERFAGARIYDNGVQISYSTNHRVGSNKYAGYTPTPAECVDLLRLAQGKAVERGDQPGTMVGSEGTHSDLLPGSKRHGIIQDSYHGTDKSSTFVVKDLPLAKPVDGLDAKVMVRRNGASRSLGRYFSNEEAAELFLGEAVLTARANLTSALDVDHLIPEFEAHREDAELGDYFPEFAADTEVAAIQRAYWDILTGRREELLHAGATAQMYRDKLEEIGDLEEAFEQSIPTGDFDAADIYDYAEAHDDLGNLAYLGTPEEKVRAHADDVVYELIGTLEAEDVLEIDGSFSQKRFDPVRVAKYMTSEQGTWSNLDSLAAALRRLNVPAEHMRGTGFHTARLQDRLVQFDPETAVPVEAHPNAFIQSMGATVRAAIDRNGAKAGQIFIDDQGVIAWEAQKMTRSGKTTQVMGEIGQVFPLGEYGEIITKFASGDNALIVPGYEARIVAQKVGENLSVEERTRLRGYEQILTDQIEYQIAGDLLTGRSEVGEGASLNNVYRRVYGTRHPVDYIERNLELHENESRDRDEILASGDTKLYEQWLAEGHGVLNSWTEAVLATEARRVRYDNAIKEGSTVYAEYEAQEKGRDAADDNHFDAWQLTGGRNMVVLTGSDANGVAAPKGFFDPVMTGGATNQGVVRYLTADAQVAADGSITPGAPDRRTPLMERPELATMAYDPFDRQQMTASTLMQAATVSAPVATAMMTFGGWTADDPIVISKRFAEANQIIGKDGSRRSLVPGDKLSDLHGNKGVISLIVDVDIDPDEAAAQGITEETAWFWQNPELDVVMSPFSAISRRNGGSARELMQKTSDLVSPLGEVAQTDGIGHMRFIVTHMAVDEKTKVYDEEAVLSGLGRKASSQLAWALGAQGCSEIMREFYGSNHAAEADFREMLAVVGLGMEADGQLRVLGRGEPRDAVAERRLFEMPELIYTKTGGLHPSANRRAFAGLIGDKGGDLEVPFPLRFPTGETIEPVWPEAWKAAGKPSESWAVPVMSSHLRSGQEFEDGTTVTHDSTKWYLEIHEQACRYRHAANQIVEGMDVDARLGLRAQMEEAQALAQQAFDSITTDLEHRVFSGKRNVFKDKLMSARLPDSATAVWTSDPRLDIDQVAMGPVMAKSLGFKEGDHALIWRDPILRDAGVRYLRVTIDDRLTGVAINPVMDACFDGDFDGDAVAVVRLHSEAAKAEALEKLSVAANVLDKGVVKGEGTMTAPRTHPFALQVSLDTQVAISKDRDLAERLAHLSGEANLNEMGAGYEDASLTRDRREALVTKLSDFYRDAQRSEFGSALSFTDAKSHLDSMREVCVITGAKGSETKLTEYAHYFGADLTSGEDLGVSQAVEEDYQNSMFATAVKAFGTGFAGKFSQRGVRVLRNADLKAVLELTYPVTQSVLQAKHDAAEARHKFAMLLGPGRSLWRGRQLEHVGPGQWRPVTDENGPVQATQEEWEKQFIDFYQAKDGFNVTVNPDYVKSVANALVGPDGRMRDIDEDFENEAALLDRMAYGGDLKQLIKAAEQGENLYNGARNEMFCSMATRQQRHRQLVLNDPTVSDGFKMAMQMDPEVGGAMPSVGGDLVKTDVLADHVAGSAARGAGRRSQHAVAVSAPAPRQRQAPVLAAGRTPTWSELDEGSAEAGDFEIGI